MGLQNYQIYLYLILNVVFIKYSDNVYIQNVDRLIGKLGNSLLKLSKLI